MKRCNMCNWGRNNWRIKVTAQMVCTHPSTLACAWNSVNCLLMRPPMTGGEGGLDRFKCHVCAATFHDCSCFFVGVIICKWKYTAFENSGLNECHVTLFYFLYFSFFFLFFRERGCEGNRGFVTSQGCSRKFQPLSALPGRLWFLQGQHALRGPGWRRPAYGGAFLPGLVHAGGFHQYGAALPFPQEQGERVLPEGAN